MVFLHVSDLHIGKKLMGRPLIEDQRHILRQIVRMAQNADAVLVAGDLYDKAQPGAEAVELAGCFLTELAKLKKPVFLISGNHDSPEQVAYCGEILAHAAIYVSPVLTSAPKPITLQDDYGDVNVYLLPFVRPVQVRRAFPERAAEVRSYADALRVAVAEMRIDTGARNVLLAHQFVAGDAMALCDSEERMVGGVDRVPAEIFKDFDYVALGHLHTPQRAGSSRMFYAGSPLKYSLSEANQSKGALLVRLGDKGTEPELRRLAYHPLRDVKSLRSTLAELTRDPVPDMDYVFVTLTDEVPPLDPVGALLQNYPNFVQLRRENSRMRAEKQVVIAQKVEQSSPLEHFLRFYRAQNNDQEPSAGQLRLLKQIIQEAEEDLHAAH